MALEIDINAITEVLLPDGWHKAEKGTFEITDLAVGETLSPSTRDFFSQHYEIDLGFTFTDQSAVPERTTSGPVTSILAIRTP